MILNKDELRRIYGHRLKELIEKTGFDFDVYQKRKFAECIDDDLGYTLYIRENKEIKTNIFYRLTLPVLFIVILISLIINWILSGKWGFSKKSKYGRFIFKWEEKAW